MLALASNACAGPDQGHKLQEPLAAAGADVEYAAVRAQVAADDIVVIPGHRIAVVAHRGEVPAGQLADILRDRP
jgi:hypothetical protein